MKLTGESFALFLLCSHLGLPDEPDAKPLGAREWNKLEARLAAASFNVAELPGSSIEQLKSTLQTDDDEATRLAWLLGRGGAIEEELERLSEFGIWIVTRFDEEYPPRFTERLKGAAPLMLYGAGSARLLHRRGLAVVGSRNIDQHGYARNCRRAVPQIRAVPVGRCALWLDEQDERVKPSLGVGHEL